MVAAAGFSVVAFPRSTGLSSVDVCRRRCPVLIDLVSRWLRSIVHTGSIS
ncbi:hypothetical protein ACE4RR_00095 [Alteribacillus sp. HJP-4]